MTTQPSIGDMRSTVRRLANMDQLRVARWEKAGILVQEVFATNLAAKKLKEMGIAVDIYGDSDEVHAFAKHDLSGFEHHILARPTTSIINGSKSLLTMVYGNSDFIFSEAFKDVPSIPAKAKPLNIALSLEAKLGILMRLADTDQLRVKSTGVKFGGERYIAEVLATPEAAVELAKLGVHVESAVYGDSPDFAQRKVRPRFADYDIGKYSECAKVWDVQSGAEEPDTLNIIFGEKVLATALKEVPHLERKVPQIGGRQ